MCNVRTLRSGHAVIMALLSFEGLMNNQLPSRAYYVQRERETRFTCYSYSISHTKHTGITPESHLGE